MLAIDKSLVENRSDDNAALGDQGGFFACCVCSAYRTRNARRSEFDRVHAIQKLFQQLLQP
ncbi:hypothetical protein XCM_15290 [Xanthomonas citri pv. mangiferaeindicae]|nr:hypothetical protein XCM_15290 [Xanthomonas citri pv. mangiferaeindicae]